MDDSDSENKEKQTTDAATVPYQVSNIADNNYYLPESLLFGLYIINHNSNNYNDAVM